MIRLITTITQIYIKSAAYHLKHTQFGLLTNYIEIITSYRHYTIYLRNTALMGVEWLMTYHTDLKRLSDVNPIVHGIRERTGDKVI